MATTRFNAYGDETQLTVHNKINNFISQRCYGRLSPLQLSYIFKSVFWTKFGELLFSVKQKLQYYFSHIEDSDGIRMSKSLEGFFITVRTLGTHRDQDTI